MLLNSYKYFNCTFVLLILSFFFNQKIFAQDISVNFQNTLTQQQEKIISNSRYLGYKYGLELIYKQNLKNNQLLFTQFNISNSISSIDKFKNEMFQIEAGIEIGYLFKLLNFWKSGPSLQARYQYDLYSLNYEHPFWLTQYSLNWLNQFKYDLNKKTSFSTFLSIPIGALISRPDKEVLYNLKDDYRKAYFNKDLKLSSFNNFQAFHIAFSLSQKLSKKTYFNAGFKIDYISYLKPRQINSLNYTLFLGVKIDFKNDK